MVFVLFPRLSRGRIVSVATLGVCLGACAHRSIRFESPEPATAELVSWDRLGGAGKDLGKLPVSIDQADLAHAAVRIVGPSQAVQYWLAADAIGLETKVTIAPVKVSGSADGSAASVAGSDKNRGYRLLLKAYEALATRDYETAVTLSEELKTLEPGVAAPLVVQGIARMQQGRANEALPLIKTAMTLDPQDESLVRLAKSLER